MTQKQMARIIVKHAKRRNASELLFRMAKICFEVNGLGCALRCLREGAKQNI